MATMLASPLSLGVLLKRAPGEAELLALKRASDAFVGAVGWPIVRSRIERLVHCNGGPSITLTARPVHAVTVEIPGVGTLEARANELSPDLVLDGNLGILTRPQGFPRGPVKVIADVGYSPDAIPGDIEDAVLERAAHLASTLGVYAQESTGSASATLAATVMGGSTQRWVETVERYRLDSWT